MTEGVGRSPGRPGATPKSGSARVLRRGGAGWRETGASPPSRKNAPLSNLDLRHSADHQQGVALSPRFRHAVRLLQMSSIDFATTVQDVLGKNPFLELDGDGEFGEPAERNAGDDAEAGGSELALDPDRDLWASDIGAQRPVAASGDGDALDLVATEQTLYACLHGQLNVLPLDWRDLVAARIVVESLDADGYLRTPLEELADRPHVSELVPPATLDELRIGLCRVQALEPSGVGARSVGECLQLQLTLIECPQLRAMAGVVVRDHLGALARRDLTGIAQALQVRPERAQAVCDRIRRLDPRPGWRFDSGQSPYIVPDVVVRKVRREWQVQLNPAAVPRLRLNQVYADLFQRHRMAAHAEMAGQLQEARWTLRNLAQRFSTIVDVAQAIVRRQRFFFDYGPMAMKPLSLREIADEIGAHESTVSRVTNGKYMATPNGVLELKYFFSRAMPSAGNGACSGTAIRSLIHDMIAAEPPAAPVSDAELARELARQGLTVARRTVTKYRQLLRIEPAERRRRMG